MIFRYLICFILVLFLISCSSTTNKNTHSQIDIIYEIHSYQLVTPKSKIFLLYDTSQYNDSLMIDIGNSIKEHFRKLNFSFVNKREDADYLVAFNLEYFTQKEDSFTKFNYINTQITSNLTYKTSFKNHTDQFLVFSINIYDNQSDLDLSKKDNYDSLIQPFKQLILQASSGLISDRYLVNIYSKCMINSLFVNNLFYTNQGVYTCNT